MGNSPGGRSGDAPPQGETVSTVKEMIQVAFEYEVKIQQLAQALQQAQEKIKVLETTLASEKASKKELAKE